MYWRQYWHCQWHMLEMQVCIGSVFALILILYEPDNIAIHANIHLVPFIL